MGFKHEKLLQETSLLIQKHFPKARIIPRHVGMFYTKHGYPIKINMAGMADAYVLMPYKGKVINIELEFKVGRDKQSEKQKNWQKIIEGMGGLYLIVKDSNVCLEKIKKYIYE